MRIVISLVVALLGLVSFVAGVIWLVSALRVVQAAKGLGGTAFVLGALAPGLALIYGGSLGLALSWLVDKVHTIEQKVDASTNLVRLVGLQAIEARSATPDAPGEPAPQESSAAQDGGRVGGGAVPDA